tara:strand:- start:2062 stop:2994 length:933 start_codon:yes stop_codon:yes gene_type:complete
MVISSSSMELMSLPEELVERIVSMMGREVEVLSAVARVEREKTMPFTYDDAVEEAPYREHARMASALLAARATCTLLRKCVTHKQMHVCCLNGISRRYVRLVMGKMFLWEKQWYLTARGLWQPEARLSLEDQSWATACSHMSTAFPHAGRHHGFGMDHSEHYRLGAHIIDEVVRRQAWPLFGVLLVGTIPGHVAPPRPPLPTEYYLRTVRRENSGNVDGLVGRREQAVLRQVKQVNHVFGNAERYVILKRGRVRQLLAHGKLRVQEIVNLRDEEIQNLRDQTSDDYELGRRERIAAIRDKGWEKVSEVEE